jgi:hypothetical protein
MVSALPMAFRTNRNQLHCHTRHPASSRHLAFVLIEESHHLEASPTSSGVNSAATISCVSASSPMLKIAQASAHPDTIFDIAKKTNQLADRAVLESTEGEAM